eukprot:TRINITY_DN5016_c0_g1_i1.p1 TRINITY_DN5016_c0_g1~~TRINITY_DN5016_c0_g1_i1.p1  ORF type:complete len:238 (+),score=56.40 TRINITY_DN5016_c0_g1_i1:18-731(+)
MALNFTPMDYQILNALNQARARPLDFRAALEHRRQNFQGNIYQETGAMAVTTQEGIHALEEAITFLKTQAPLPEFHTPIGLTYASRDLIAEISSNTSTSSPSDRIQQYCTGWSTVAEDLSLGEIDGFGFIARLVIDDGVRDRANRMNIYNPVFECVGIASGIHPIQDSCCVITFADKAEDNGTAQKSRAKYDECKRDAFGNDFVDEASEDGPRYVQQKGDKGQLEMKKPKCMFCTIS